MLEGETNELGSGMPQLPSGTVTFLMTDVVGSTRLWIEDPANMRVAMARHDELGKLAFESSHGFLVRERGEGDSLFGVFSRPSDALSAAQLFVESLRAEPWPGSLRIEVRAGIHTGEDELREGDYYGQSVNRCARIRAVANPGQVLVSGASRQLVSGRLPEGLSLYDMGQHRLKDLLSPERLFVLHRSSDPPVDTALHSLGSVRHNLPVRLTTFIGREAEMESLSDLLRKCRLVTLTGMGGSGKTSVAVQVAAEYAESYPGGIWFVDLSSSESGGRVAQTIASAMGVTRLNPVDSLKGLLPLFSTEPTLVILDNCEKLVDEVALTAKALLEGVGNLTVLATSREPLRLSGERVLPIGTLSVSAHPDAQSLHEIERMDSYRLFVDRALARNPALKIDESFVRDVAAICQAVDGIALAVEQVASHVSSLTVKQVRDRLSDRLKLARSRDRDVAERHSTLRAAIAWSFETLDSPAKELFGRLAVFPDGWTLEAAESVCSGGQIDDGDVYDLLDTLVDKSLVVTSAQPDGSTRFRYLTTIHQFASEAQLDDQQELSKRFVDWFLKLCAEARNHLSGSDQAHWLQILDQESNNIRRALRWCEENSPERLLPFANLLPSYWYRRGQMFEAIRWLRSGLQTSDSKATELHATSLSSLALFEWQIDNIDLARSTYLEAISLLQELGLKHFEVKARVNLASLESDAGRADEAILNYTVAQDLYAELGDRHGVAMCLENLGIFEVNRGNRQAGIPLLMQSLELFRSYEDKSRIVHAQGVLCDALLDEGRDAEAMEGVSELIRLWPSVSDLVSLALVGFILIRVRAQVEPHLCAKLCGALEHLLPTGLTSKRSRHFTQALRAIEENLPAEELATGRKLGESLDTNGVFALCKELLHAPARAESRQLDPSKLRPLL